MNKYEVHFEYHDQFSRGSNYSKQTWFGEAESEYEAIKKCKQLYGLGIDPDCEYKIIAVKQVGQRGE